MAVEDAGERLRFVRAEGFDCSAKESAAQRSKLEDAELEAAAGGVDLDTNKGVEDPYGFLRYSRGFK